MKKVEILDCTLRDGSYTIDYKFTTFDTYLITQALVSAGVPYIEIGHGLGLDAQRKGKGRASSSDLDYITAASRAKTPNSKIGVFYIPGIGEESSIHAAHDAGIDFIRIGVSADDIAQALKAIELSQNLGVEVSVNLMKSYCFTPRQLTECAKTVVKAGASVVAIVDSAGGMLPNQVREYITDLCQISGLRIGFHGHNNLQLAIANCLAAIEAGASVIDTSLKGMGRSAGNAVTEILALILSRDGYDCGLTDARKLLRIADEIIQPLFLDRSVYREIDVASGIAFFHSGFQNIVDAAAEAHGIKSSDLILELGKDPRFWHTVNKPDAEKIAQKIPRSQQNPTVAGQEDYLDLMHGAPYSPKLYLENILETSKKMGTIPGVVIARNSALNTETPRYTPIRSNYGYSIGHVESPDHSTDIALHDALGALNMHTMAEADIFRGVEQPENRLVRYVDSDIMQIAIRDFLLAAPVRLVHVDQAVKQAIPSVLQNVTFDSCECAVIANDDSVSIAAIEEATRLNRILLLRAGSLSAEKIAVAKAKNIEIIRLDYSNALIAEAARLFNLRHQMINETGVRQLGEFSIVSGGIVANSGAIIVDNVNRPLKIFGISDGLGGVIPLSQLTLEVRRKIFRFYLSLFTL